MGNSVEQEYVYGGKCRQCENKNAWYFGGSGFISPDSFVLAMHEKLKYGTFCFCDKCKVNTIHDVTFYGNKNDYKILIDKLSEN